MNIIIQKFGGTSVATKELREKVAKKVILSKQEGKIPVVVVSAIGRSGDPYATDTLIGLANHAFKEQSSRELDMIMACGEIISAVIMANTIKATGYDAVALTGFQAGIITDEYHGDAEVTRVDCEPILSLLKEGKIPVVTGFQGATLTGDITTLGRGGSDTTAALLGEALEADVVEIYTDVDGVMTADPRLVPEAKVIDTICYDEIYQMAEDGAKVVHPRAVEIARRGNITLKIKNTFSDAPGTIINGKIGSKGNSYRSGNEGDLLTAIAHKNGITQFTVFFNGDSVEESERFMNELTDNHISIDLINFFTDRKVFTVEEKNVEKLEQILNKLEYKFQVAKDCSKITAIGHKIRGVPGVMARIVKALAGQGVKILQSSDSHTTISCLVSRKDMEKAVNALHQEFNLSR
ncbi:aspartate kinase [Anaerosolibacter carboniphilus]|uniref:Aspartokinase n=1 Tax=Anaerosolibacter carboniphilus TaxID=1417629 RepID=A0A841L046_9FIRM|nr:aspartate kinase [Anaerosolibacter carboniphilus]MBB6216532.1 aspartate kinase [Anaerosolibacter carboniphilus]